MTRSPSGQLYLIMTKMCSSLLWISDKMSNGLKRANTLLTYITAYHKGKSIDDLTLNYINILRNEQ